ncbi:D-alanyl-D-alanine carboxypeptidase [Alkalibacter sp. M17DMB]|nr:D-alanyl-D-alanine carboxypeptidase [Alkalibacter mobilis]
MLYEKNTGQILYGITENERRYPASLTKLMTAAVAMDYMELDEKIVPGPEIHMISSDSSRAGLKEGREMIFADLMAAMLLPSGNDAANTVAVLTARKSVDDPNMDIAKALEVFSNLMNEKAMELGMIDSNFTNPHGLHDESHYTTAEDMLKLALYIQKDTFLNDLVSKPVYHGIDQELVFYSTNVFLHETLDDIWFLRRTGSNPDYNPYVNGMKTGNTNEAGRCVVFSAERDGISLIGVILKSDLENIYPQGNSMIDMVFENMIMMETPKKGDLVGEITIDLGFGTKEMDVSLINGAGFKFLSNRDEIDGIKYEIKITSSSLKYKGENTYDLEEDIFPGETVGKLLVYSGGEIIGETMLSVDERIENKNMIAYLVMALVALTLILLITRKLVKR